MVPKIAVSFFHLWNEEVIMKANKKETKRFQRLFFAHPSQLFRVIILLLFFLAANAFASNWQVAGPGDWFESANWDAGVPNSSEGANITNSSSTQVQINATSAECYTFLIRQGAIHIGANGILTTTANANSFVGYLGSASFLVNGGKAYVRSLHVGYRNGNGVVTISGGEVTGTMYVGSGVSGQSWGGTGTVTLSGGGIHENSAYYFKLGTGYNTATGTYNLVDGTFSCQHVLLGDVGKGYFNQSGGTATITVKMDIGNTSGSYGWVTVSDGALNVTGSGGLVFGNESGSYGGAALSGGTINVTSGNISVPKDGSADFYHAGGTVNCTSGTLFIGNSGTAGLYKISGASASCHVKNLTVGANGNLAYELTSASASTIQISNTLTLNGASTLTITFNGYTPQAGDSWDLFDAGAVSGTFGTVSLPDLSSYGWCWDITKLYSDGKITILPYNTSWQTAGPGDWFTSGNWSSGTPDINDDILISVTSADAQINAAGAQCKSMTIASGGTGQGTVTIGSGGSLSTGSSNSFVGYDGGSGTFTMSGGSAYIQNFYVAYSNSANGVVTASGGALSGNMVVGTGSGSGGVGVVTLSGATHNVGPNQFELGSGHADASGTYNLTGGTLTCPDWLIGNVGKGYFNQSGGTATLSGSMTVGNTSGSYGWVTLSSGSLNVNGTQINVSSAGTGSFYHSGGSLNCTSGTLFIGNSGTAGVYKISGASASCNVQNLTVGANGNLAYELTSASTSTVQVSGTLTLNASSTLTITFNGYTPQVGDSWDLFDAGTVSGTSFGTVSLPDVSANELNWDTSLLYSDGKISLVQKAVALGASTAGLGIDSGDIKTHAASGSQYANTVTLSWDTSVKRIIYLSTYGAGASPVYTLVTKPNESTYINSYSLNENVLELTVSGSVGSADFSFYVTNGSESSSVTTIHLNVVNNFAPVVDAGDAQEVKSASFSVAGTASDQDGGSMTYLWEKVSGPGIVTFNSSVSKSTSVQVAEKGEYLLRFTASDWLESVSDTVTITVNIVAPTLEYANITNFEKGARRYFLATYLQSGRFDFRVKYSDPETGEAPNKIQVHIDTDNNGSYSDSEKFNLSLIDGSDYKTGVIYGLDKQDFPITSEKINYTFYAEKSGVDATGEATAIVMLNVDTQMNLPNGRQVMACPSLFNPGIQKTAILFNNDQESDVDIFILSLSGKLVWSTKIINLPKGAGNVKWDGKNKSGFGVASGVYICRVILRQSNGGMKVHTQKIVVLNR
jgi:hypothetical protein